MDRLKANISDVPDLISRLQHENLFVNDERKTIRELNEKLCEMKMKIMKTSWINAQERINLHTFIKAPESAREQCCKKSISLPKSSFVNAKDVWDYQTVTQYSDFLRLLRGKPEQLAYWLVNGERVGDDSRIFYDILCSIITGLYGSLILSEDVNLVLILLKHLAYLQLVSNENPKRLLSQGNCTFSKLYFLLHENLHPAKLFLISTLQTPIINLIAKVDFFLDIDPDTVILRFTSKEKAKKFGLSGTVEYERKICEYRANVVRLLVDVTNDFILSLHENIFCFPDTLAWLLRQINKMMANSFGSNSKEANVVITDLFFTSFVCHAIVNPNRYGICDAPISDVARHNLVQVGQILQMLALHKHETPDDQKLVELYSMFDANAVLDIVDTLLQNGASGDEPPVQKVPEIPRTVSLFTEQELYNLVTFLQTVHTINNMNVGVNGDSGSNFHGHINSSNISSLDHLVALLLTLSDFHENPSQHQTAKSVPSSPSSASKKNLLNRVTKNHLPRSQSMSYETEVSNNAVVLIIPMQQQIVEPIGLFSENKVLLDLQQLQCEPDNFCKEKVVTLPNGDLTTSQGKRTRFSIQDDGSIGNTSDNLEAVSEAASNHSADSSIELEETEDQNDNDNLSDMVSANVSGRGSPNISGRDTPSSQVTENEDARAQPEARQQLFQQPHHMNKQIRSEIDDKFCKFEIKKHIEGDETVSIISDTWSTDVLASDSETIDASDGRQEHTNFPAIVEQSIDGNISNPLLDISETQSESAWSMDVLASDTERLTEVDNDDLASVAPSDDAASVARSDDTASVAPSDDASRSELEENSLLNVNSDRRSSAPGHSSIYMNNIDIGLYNNDATSNFCEYTRETLSKLDEREFNNNNSNSFGNNGMIPDGDVCMLVTNFEHSVTIKDNIASETKSKILDTCRRDVIDSNISKINELQGILNKRTHNEGTNGMDKNNPDEAVGMKSAMLISRSMRSSQKYKETHDMQLSNCSLNSSSSGSSNDSEARCKNTNYMLHKENWKGKMWMNGSESSLNITSTPSESTSELSVLSVNTLVSPINNITFLEQKNAALNMKTSRIPGSSTGAIPKSISFDMSADKGGRDLDDDPKNKRGFFGKFRMGFRNRRGKSFRMNDEFNGRNSGGDEEGLGLRRGYSDFLGKPPHFSSENSEDILAKYRNKNVEPTDANHTTALKPVKPSDIEDKELKIEFGNVTSDFAFADHKRKFRLVLSNCQGHYSPISREERKDVKIYLEMFLQLELSKAKSLKEWPTVARISEVLRCVRVLDSVGCHKLFEILKDDYCQRFVYMQYLLQSKQTLLSMEANLKSLEDQLKVERELCSAHFMEVFVEYFFEGRENDVQTFCNEFQNLKLVDEKNDLLSAFLSKLYTDLHKECLFKDSIDVRMNLARIAVEQSVMTKVYLNALYPNGDGDRDRDRVLSEHLKKLSNIITPSHKDLLINKMYHNECPWLPAQEALRAMAAYRIPRDKVCCVTRCTTSIMDLLSLARARGSTTADDFIPVLVYVIIKVNPQDLLSTIQYVNSFYGNQIGGEDGYWWTQFCSAVEYTKTMDYSY